MNLIPHSATIAQSYNEFWVGVPSQPVQIVRRDVSGELKESFTSGLRSTYLSH